MRIFLVLLLIGTSTFLSGLNSQGNYDAQDILDRMRGYASETPSLLLSFAGIGTEWSSVTLAKDDQNLHLGVSMTLGMTIIPGASWSKVTRPLNTELYSVVLPTRTYVGRFGWPSSPMDFGAWYKETTSNLMSSVNFNASSYGFLSRTQLVRSGQSGFDLALAVNAGVSHVKMATAAINDLIIDDIAASRQVFLLQPKLTTEQKVYSVDLAVLASKQFWGFLSPYGGLSLTGGIGETSLNVASRSVLDSASSLPYWTKYFPNISNSGFSNTTTSPAFSPAVLAGAGLQIQLVWFDLGSRIDIASGAMALEATGRVQL